MATTAQILANRQNATASTGPLSDLGKSTSAANSTKLGLFSKRDFVRPEERPLWEELRQELLTQLQPQGALEQTFSDEIISANWRLRRCGLVEAEIQITDPDQAGAEFVNPTFQSIDRARSHASRILARAMAQLKNLQHERILRETIYHDPAPHLGLASIEIYNQAAVNRSRRIMLERRTETSGLEFAVRQIELDTFEALEDCRADRARNSAKRTQSDLSQKPNQDLRSAAKSAKVE